MKMKRPILILSILSVVTILAFQNCSDEVQFQELPELVDKKEGGECVPGERFGVWLDRDDSGTIKSQDFLGHVVGYTGTEDAAKNYNYYSASAHIKVGPQPQDQMLNVFFYKSPSVRRLSFEWPAVANAISYTIDFAPDATFAVDTSNPDDFLLRYASKQPNFEWGTFEERNYYWRVIAIKPDPDDASKTINQTVVSGRQLDLTNLVSIAADGAVQQYVEVFTMPEHLALNIFANRDVTPGSEGNGNGELDILVRSSGNNQQDRYLLMDDPGVDPDTFDRTIVGSEIHYDINTRYGNNTDGAVMGPYIGEDYKIRVKISKAGNSNDGRFHSADGSSFSLKESIDGTAFIITRAGYETCGQ